MNTNQRSLHRIALLGVLLLIVAASSLVLPAKSSADEPDPPWGYADSLVIDTTNLAPATQGTVSEANTLDYLATLLSLMF